MHEYRYLHEYTMHTYWHSRIPILQLRIKANICSYIDSKKDLHSNVMTMLYRKAAIETYIQTLFHTGRPTYKHTICKNKHKWENNYIPKIKEIQKQNRFTKIFNLTLHDLSLHYITLVFLTHHYKYYSTQHYIIYCGFSK